jgi:hypothetical protein
VGDVEHPALEPRVAGGVCGRDRGEQHGEGGEEEPEERHRLA